MFARQDNAVAVTEQASRPTVHNNTFALKVFALALNLGAASGRRIKSIDGHAAAAQLTAGHLGISFRRTRRFLSRRDHSSRPQAGARS